MSLIKPALLRLSAMISQYFTRYSACFALHTAMTKEPLRSLFAISSKTKSRHAVKRDG